MPRAIGGPVSPGVAGSLTVTSGASGAQVGAARGPDRSDSQADSAGSIPVTRSALKAPDSGAFVSFLDLSRTVRGFLSLRAPACP